VDIQRALISRALRDRAFRTLIDNGVTESYFPDVDHANVFRWALEYWQTHGDSPTARALKQNFPSYKLVRVEEPLSYCIDELREQLKRARVEEAMLEATVLRNQEGTRADEVINLLEIALVDTHIEASALRDVNVSGSWRSRWDQYKRLKELPDGMRGITFGFPALDEVTSGAQDGQLITVIGEPKVGKSTLLLRMAKAAHEAGKKVLFIGFEMSNEEQLARFDSMVAGVDHARLMKGKLGPEAEKRLRRQLRLYHERTSDNPFIMTEDISSTTTVPGVQAKIQQYQPDIIFIDGVYLMDDVDSYTEKGSAQHLTNVTRGLKRLALNSRRPVVCTTQVLTWKMPKKAKGLTADAIGYSSSFAQDSDLIVGAEHTALDSEKVIRIVLSRNTARLWIKVSWDWATGNFTEIPGSGDWLGSSDDEEGGDGEEAFGLRV
jgi:replicative DNA helicase